MPSFFVKGEKNMNERIKEKLKFETFTEFCERADEILEAFKIATMYPTFSIKEYKNYIYISHKFSKNSERDIGAKDKCWEWLMTYKYEYMNKNDLYSTLGQLKKGN